MKTLEQKPISSIEASPNSIVGITPTTAIAESEQALAIKEKAKDLKKFKQTDKLIKAITDLSTLTKKKVDAEKKEAPRTVLGFLGKMAKEGVKNTTMGMKDSLLSKVGLGKNQALGGYLADRKKAKLEDLQSKVDFRSKVAAHTEAGRALQVKIDEAKTPEEKRKLEEQLTRRSARLQVIRDARSKQIESLQEEKSAVTSTGMTYSPEKEAKLQRKKSKQETQFMSKDQKETYSLEQEADKEWERSRNEEVKKKKAYALRVKQGIKKDKSATAKVEPVAKTKAATEPDELDRAYSQAERAGDKVSMMLIEKARAQRDNQKPAKQETDLLDVNEKQLEALNKIVAATTVTEEDKLESKKPESSVKVVAAAAKEEKKGLFDSLTDLFKGMIPGFEILTKLPAMFSAIAPILSAAAPAAAVAAAGTAGYMFGKHVVNPALNAGAEAITGVKGETVGSATYKGADKIAGWFGNSDEDKQKAAEQKSWQDNYNQRVNNGKLTPKLAEIFENHGIKVDRSKISTVSSIDKPLTATREIQTANLEQSTAEAATIAAKETAGTNKGPAVVDASVKSITNNNTVQTKPSPPVRNFEPSFNTRLRSQFA